LPAKGLRKRPFFSLIPKSLFSISKTENTIRFGYNEVLAGTDLYFDIHYCYLAILVRCSMFDIHSPCPACRGVAEGEDGSRLPR
jgi:hypothetical protein